MVIICHHPNTSHIDLGGLLRGRVIGNLAPTCTYIKRHSSLVSTGPLSDLLITDLRPSIRYVGGCPSLHPPNTRPSPQVCGAEPN